MVDESYRNSMSEVLDVLSHSKREVLVKIPQNVLDFLIENSSKTYESKLDHSKNIKDMGLSKKAENFISLIYRNYLCDNNKKQEYDYILRVNEEKYEKDLREKYNPNNIFKNNINNSNNINNNITESFENVNQATKEVTSLVEVKENFFTKLVNKIKSLLKIDK